jgi:hypothetical protein
MLGSSASRNFLGFGRASPPSRSAFDNWQHITGARVFHHRHQPVFDVVRMKPEPAADVDTAWQ